MSGYRDVTLGERIFSKINENAYLQKLYHKILFNYSKRLLNLDELEEEPINIKDALVFADILSKSCNTDLADIHKTRAQEIVALLHSMYPDNEDVKYYLGSILSNTGNYIGFNRLTPDFISPSILQQISDRFNMDYLSISSNDGAHFFPAQKEIFDGLSKQYLSYSTPPSMGKSFIIREFIKKNITEGVQKNFVILLPTRALINETVSELIESLTTLLTERDYRIITSTGSIALEKKHNYIFVLTPERMLSILIAHPNIPVDYVFVDEAHKISSEDKRSAFYFKVIGKIEEQNKNAHFIFASPNIPNPNIYLSVLLDEIDHKQTDDSAIACKYSPVTQLKYVIDLYERNIRIYDSYSKKFINFAYIKWQYNLSDVISEIGNSSHNIVYCNSKNDCVQFAIDYAKTKKGTGDSDLRDFAKSIRNDVHKDYYLANLVEKGVAYHIGYLPANIRLQLENFYRKGLIKTIFCTSTLLEGVNLPAENLFITSHKKGLKKFSEVDFKNLIGRVGRVKYNLYGNVFIVRLQKDDRDGDLQKIESLLKNDVPAQKLSIEKELKKTQKEHIIATLLSGNIEIVKKPVDQSKNNYDLMRKIMLILVSDIVNEKNSRVKREFKPFLTPETEAKIRKLFSVPFKKPEDDINVSTDQIQNIKMLIQNGLTYPEITDPQKGPDYNETLDFLCKLADALKWRVYESDTLGFTKGADYPKLKWYAVLLIQWMQGYGLSYILNQSIKYFKKYKREVRVLNRQEIFDDLLKHKNIVIADTLEAIEEVLLFRLSNYFLKFSQEYKIQHPNEPFFNNWYEFIEYGTTNRLRIILQRSGFHRESTEYIRKNIAKFVVGTPDEPKLLKNELLNCSNELVQHDVNEIQYNVPELFIDGE